MAFLTGGWRRRERGFTNVLGATRAQLDLRDQAAVNYWFKTNKPEWRHTIELREGLASTYAWFCRQAAVTGVPARD